MTHVTALLKIDVPFNSELPLIFNDEIHVTALFKNDVPFNNELPLTFNDETHVVAFNNDILLLEFIIIALAPAPDCNIKFPILLKILSPDIADDEKAGVDATP